MRALLAGALGLTLLGCSHSPPPQAASASCGDGDAATCSDAAAGERNAQAASVPATTHAKVSLAKSVKPSTAKTAVHATTAPRARSAAAFGNAQASVADRHGGEAPDKAATSGSPAQQMAAATMAPEARTTPAAAVNADALVAVVMVRPDVKSVAELAGKIVAIDDRYSASNGTVRTAIVAAGAPEVQLSQGQATAMNRLTNGEVPGAVVALLTPEAAETFPAIAGYKTFHVPLSPRSLKAGR